MQTTQKLYKRYKWRNMAYWIFLFWQLAFREDIRKEQIVERIVKQLKTGNAELKTLCAKTIEKVSPMFKQLLILIE